MKLHVPLRTAIISAFISTLCHGMLYAQSGTHMEEGAQVDSLQNESVLAYTIYGGMAFAGFSDRSALFAGGGAGVIFGKRFVLEANFSTMVDRFTKRIIFPEVYRYRMWKAGVAPRYNLVFRKWYYAYGALHGTFAHASWTPTESSAESFVDYVYMIAPEGGAGLRVLPFVAVEAGIRYNKAFGFELIGLEDGALDGIEVDLRIRFSYPANRRVYD